MGSSCCRNDVDALDKADMQSPEVEKAFVDQLSSLHLFTSDPTDVKPRSAGLKLKRRASLADLSEMPGLLDVADTPKINRLRHAATMDVGLQQYGRSQDSEEHHSGRFQLEASKTFLAELQIRRAEKLAEQAELAEDHVEVKDSNGHGIVGVDNYMRVHQRIQSRMRKSRSFNDIDDQQAANVDSDIDTKKVVKKKLMFKEFVSTHELGADGSECEGGHRITRMQSDLRARNEKAKLKRSNSVMAEIGRGASMALQIIVENPRDIHEVYDFAKTLGKGSFGTVRQTKVKATGAMRAVKSIQKNRIGSDILSMLKTEMKITKMVDHPNIVMLHEIFEDVLNLYLVMELCLGGHLHKRLKDAEPFGFTERQVAVCMQQILRAVLYLHNNGICHRDIKLENILLVSTADVEKTRLKMTDFGVSCIFKPGQVLKAKVGTPDFMAPEVIKKKYGPECDVWSCGVSMYVLCSDTFPFTGADKEAVFQKILTGRFTFGARFVDASQGAMDFMAQLLHADPKKRLSAAKGALKHVWFEEALPETTMQRMDSVLSLGTTLFSHLCKFKKQNRFIRAASCLVACLLSKEQVASAHEAFEVLDVDGSGVVTQADVKHKLEELMSKKEISKKNAVALRQVLKEVERGFGNYTYTEFLAATFNRAKYLREDVCRAVFSAFDQDGNGTISLEELASGALLGHLKTSELVKLVEECDLNGDGEIDFEEFLTMMRGSA